jgi:hypothetical protein
LTNRLNEVMEDATAGDPMSSVKWSRKSARSVGRTLKVSSTKAYRMLRAGKYRLRFNRKRLTKKSHAHRDQQFRIINRLKASFARQGQPVISAWRKEPKDVGVYDFPSDAEGVAIPYGIYDVTRGDGFVVVGTSHNTPEFATNAVQTWWNSAGRKAHAEATELLVLADSGSSNGARAREWKTGLQRIANDTGLKIRVAHYPTGASKWNPVEHRLFGPISNNWAGQPLVDYPTVCNRIRSTRTTSGRRCKVVLDRRTWLTQKEKAAAGMDTSIPIQEVAIKHGRNLPQLNYTIVPRASRQN